MALAEALSPSLSVSYTDSGGLQELQRKVAHLSEALPKLRVFSVLRWLSVACWQVLAWAAVRLRMTVFPRSFQVHW